jgi:ankyrin repeat protein
MLVGLARLALLFIVPAISTNTISASSNQELLDAVQAGHLGTVETLLRLDGSSVDVNAVIDDVWALYLAARAGRLEIVEILLVNGADTNVATHSGHTALGAAAFGGHLSVAAKLLTAGAYINSITEQGETPLHAVARAGHNEKGDLSETCAVFKVGDPETCVTSVLSALVAAGAFVNANGKGGQTPLHLACTAGHSKTVSALLEAGAFVDLQDISGFTPLHIVTGYGFVE